MSCALLGDVRAVEHLPSFMDLRLGRLALSDPSDVTAEDEYGRTSPQACRLLRTAHEYEMTVKPSEGRIHFGRSERGSGGLSTAVRLRTAAPQLKEVFGGVGL